MFSYPSGLGAITEQELTETGPVGPVRIVGATATGAIGIPKKKSSEVGSPEWLKEYWPFIAIAGIGTVILTGMLRG